VSDAVTRRAAAIAAAGVLWLASSAGAATEAQEPPMTSSPGSGRAQAPPEAAAQSGPAGGTLADARRLFYDGRYLEAAERARTLRAAGSDELAADELRSSALLFQLKRLVGDARDKQRAFEACDACAEPLAELLATIKQGQTAARARLALAPDDLTARFYLGKLNLNYVWLQLGVLGRRTGWNEYREARRSMDAVLEREPAHVRARVARAWIEYIVDTRAPWGFAWILGGGSKRRALETLHAAAADPAAAYFDRIEAEFALWEMQVRERNLPAATAVARGLATQFPENRELARFLAEHRD
jgi:hypothetical protein